MQKFLTSNLSKSRKVLHGYRDENPSFIILKTWPNEKHF